MKRYRCRALVTLLPQHAGEAGAPLPGPLCRMVVRAQHPKTHQSKIFSALVAASEDLAPPGSAHVAVNLTVLGDDANEYLAQCQEFSLWRGREVGHGVITRRAVF